MSAGQLPNPTEIEKRMKDVVSRVVGEAEHLLSTAQGAIDEGRDVPRHALLETAFQFDSIEEAFREIQRQRRLMADARMEERFRRARAALQAPSAATNPAVPRISEIILEYVCRPGQVEAVLGDLESRFRKKCAKDGEAAARRWYRWQVARSLVWYGLSGAALLEVIRRKLGL